MFGSLFAACDLTHLNLEQRCGFLVISQAFRNAQSSASYHQQHVSSIQLKLSIRIGAQPREIVFTSGATESNNLAIKGVANFYKKNKKHIITTQTEHKCVLDSCRVLQQQEFDVTYLGVNSEGLIDIDEFKAAIRPDTVMASVMYVNNEIGVIQPLQEIGSICREHKVCLSAFPTSARHGYRDGIMVCFH